MAAFFKLALRIHKLCHILVLLSGDSHRETRSGVDDAVYAEDVLLHRPPLHFQKTYKNVADAKTTSATSAAILRGHLHIICMEVAGRRRTAPDDTGRHRPVPYAVWTSLYCGVLFCFLTNVDVRLLHLNKPVSQSVSQSDVTDVILWLTSKHTALHCNFIYSICRPNYVIVQLYTLKKNE